IKGALKKLVQINQSAFIPERIIQDNILLSQEILKGYGRKNGAKREVTNNEIKDAIFDIRDNRASRPDGYTSLFIKKAWKVVRNDLCEAIKEFFCNGKILGLFLVAMLSTSALAK
nr:RNA-directed DNA polymerase, eukaryota, reverse transcriptase zinc-binding domain protein [Tanacetum cinerariifolium]